MASPLAMRTTVREQSSGFTALLSRINARARFVDVGIHGLDGADLVKIASAQEFGATINNPGGQPYIILDQSQITNRGMKRASVPISGGKALLFLKQGKQGMGVTKPSVTRIPPRPYMRPTVDENMALWRQLTARLWGRVLDGEITKFEGLSRLGLEVSRRIQLKIRALRNPPNAPSTIWKKGSTNPLIDSGRMVGSVRHIVKDR